jgi:hypothetical protein
VIERTRKTDGNGKSQKGNYLQISAIDPRCWVKKVARDTRIGPAGVAPQDPPPKGCGDFQYNDPHAAARTSPCTIPLILLRHGWQQPPYSDSQSCRLTYALFFFYPLRSLCGFWSPGPCSRNVHDMLQLSHSLFSSSTSSSFSPPKVAYPKLVPRRSESPSCLLSLPGYYSSSVVVSIRNLWDRQGRWRCRLPRTVQGLESPFFHSIWSCWIYSCSPRK